MPKTLIQAATLTFILHLIMGLSTSHNTRSIPFMIGQALEAQERAIPFSRTHN